MSYSPSQLKKWRYDIIRMQNQNNRYTRTIKANNDLIAILKENILKMCLTQQKDARCRKAYLRRHEAKNERFTEVTA